MAAMNQEWGIEKSYDNKETREILGIDFKPWQTSVADMVPTLKETGYIPTQIKKGC